MTNGRSAKEKTGSSCEIDAGENSRCAPCVPCGQQKQTPHVLAASSVNLFSPGLERNHRHCHLFGFLAGKNVSLDSRRGRLMDDDDDDRMLQSEGDSCCCCQRIEDCSRRGDVHSKKSSYTPKKYPKNTENIPKKNLKIPKKSKDFFEKLKSVHLI